MQAASAACVGLSPTATAFVHGLVRGGGTSEGILATGVKGGPHSTGVGVLFGEAPSPSAGQTWAVASGSASPDPASCFSAEQAPELFPQGYAASRAGLVLEGSRAWERTGLQRCEAHPNSSFLVFQMFRSCPQS